MRTIGYYDDSRGHSGTTQYLQELLTAIDRAKYVPIVFSPRPAPWHQNCRDLGAVVATGLEATPRETPIEAAAKRPEAKPWASRAGIDRAKKTLSMLRTMRREVGSLRRLFSAHPVDLLHSNNVGEEIAPIVARRTGIPIVVGTLHVDPTYDIFAERTGWIHSIVRQRSFRSLDMAIAVSERTKDEWVRELHTGPRKCPRLVVVPNGIRVERLIRRRSIEAAKLELGVQPDALVIGSIGRLDWAKGYRDMIAALPTILKAAPNAVFVHAGLGPLDGLLQDDARRLGVSGSIVWLGFRSDVRDLLEASDLYVQPSWCEAHTLSVLEAGAMSLAVVASDVGGHRETLESDRGGWIVAPRQPEELASAVMTALGDAVARQTRGRWLGSRVRTYYTHDRMVAETMALYENLFTTAGAS